MATIVSPTFTDAQLQAVDAALTELEAQLAALVSLTSREKAALPKMGEKSEAFCRQALRVLDQNRQLVPPNLPLAGALADLTMIDQLRPRLVRLSRLAERVGDTDTVLGANVMDVALQSYGLLKLRGKGEGLKALRHELGVRFRRRASARPDTALPKSGSGSS